MSELQWGSVYNAYAPDYRVPTKVVAAIGGDRNGGATATQPVNGFAHEDLAAMFEPPKKEMPSKSGRLRWSTKFIIGGTVGGVSMIAMAASVIFFYRRRLGDSISNREWPRAEIDGNGTAEAEMDAVQVPLELAVPGPVKFIEPYEHPLELCGRDSDVPWRELQPRDSDLPWEELEAKTCTPPPPWEPTVTEEGVPF